jgi:hypothetical protein
MKEKAIKARPARIEAGDPHVSAALVAREAAPIATTVQITIRSPFRYHAFPQA